MRHVTGAVSAVVLLMSSLSWAAAPEPANDEQKTLYALGAAISQSLGPFTLNESELEFVKAGLVDGVLKHPQKVDLQVYGPKIQQMQQVRATALAEVEKKAGAGFLAKAAAESGAKKTESGAIVTTIKEGKGATPKATDTVKVQYH
ncbi:MAG: FKBP-type peptidyl-prolyl cis-trans isomerase, partial [Nitrospira sp.]|nr:FKBP-type peptidyl-prolyl cis-trans isomerase [Nitrospira sp.]